MTPAEKKALKALLGRRAKPELKTLFALVRANTDRTLLAALAPPKKKPAKKGDPLVREIDQALKPILGPATEKADLLVEHLAKKHKRKLAIEPKGVADAVKRLRAAKFTDKQIRAGAATLMADLAETHSARETVV